MGRPWFPLALFGFALLAAAVYSIGYDTWFDYGAYTVPVTQGMGTGGVGGTGYGDGTVTMATAIQVSGNGQAVGWGPGLKTTSSTWLVLNIALFLGTLTWYAVRARRRGKPIRPWPLAGLALGVPVALVLADLTMFWQWRLDAGVRGPLITAAELVVLAWLERSLPVLLVALLFALIDIVLFGGVAGALVAAAVAFAGAFVTLLRPRREPPVSTADTP